MGIKESWAKYRNEVEGVEVEVIDIKDYKGPILLPGGKGPISTDGDWLSPLPVGTVFLAKEKTNRNNLGNWQSISFAIAGKTEHSVVLNTSMAPGNIFAIPAAFCRLFDFVEDLGAVIEKEQQEQEEAGHDRDRIPGDTSVPPAKVE